MMAALGIAQRHISFVVVISGFRIARGYIALVLLLRGVQGAQAWVRVFDIAAGLGYGDLVEVARKLMEGVTHALSLHCAAVHADNNFGLERSQTLDRGSGRLPILSEVHRRTVHLRLLCQHGVSRLLLCGDECIP